jgi:DNA-directed RNA polymerase subunit M/transcription elongation factor TFIIS|uniref:TFIIS-type domain-containing protein n=1 Tax=viral metagenome TaxID=1070528 RepID=A0A6C0D0J6_9ZZZZ
MTSYRETGKLALSTVLDNENNITLFEQYIYDNSLGEKDQECVYKTNLYQTVIDIMDKHKLKTLAQNIKENKIGWNHPTFDELNQKRLEQDNFIENPFEVAEGVITCKCGSKRVFSYSKQVRGGDEATSTFAQCIACKAKWVQNN